MVERLSKATPARVPLLFRRFALDAALLALVLLTSLPVLRSLWSRLGPFGSPMGPDADENFLAAIALERGLPAVYASDRYPAFAWLVALVASGPLDVHPAAVRLSAGFALAAGVAAYVLGRQLGGPAVGAVASALTLRLPGIVDVSRQFTPYMMVACLDLVAVALTLGLLRGRRLGVPLAVVLAVLWAADPKQMPVVLGFVAVGGCASLAHRSLVGVVGALALVAAVPVANRAAASLGVQIFSVEEIAGRVDLGLVAPPVPAAGGYRLGGDLRALPATLERLASTRPRSSRGWLHERVRTSLPMEFPRTSLLWLLPAALGCFSLRAGWRRALVTPLAVAPLAPLLVATLHLHFQHRYFAGLAAPLPALVGAGIALVGGPGAAIGAGLVALCWPTSPWSGVAPGLLGRPPVNAEPWTGREPPDWAQALSQAVDRLPEGAVVVDYSQSRPWTMLAAPFDYHRCSQARDGCRSVVGAGGSPLVAVLVPGEALSVAAPGASSLAGQVDDAATIGSCWTVALNRPGPGAAYLWTCPEPPSAGVGRGP